MKFSDAKVGDVLIAGYDEGTIIFVDKIDTNGTEKITGRGLVLFKNRKEFADYKLFFIYSHDTIVTRYKYDYVTPANVGDAQYYCKANDVTHKNTYIKLIFECSNKRG